MASRQETFNDYEGFVEKFKPKKTTDDCYTPKEVYDVILEWAVERYGIGPSSVVRPFYPGGDYEAFDYPRGCVVLDNPPFSILAKIQGFYLERGIRFFLFAPALTCLSGKDNVMRTNHILCDTQITYENGAVVPTAFVTNLDDGTVIESCPDLGKRVKAACDAIKARSTKTIPKYEFPDHVLTAAKVNWFAAHGTPFKVSAHDCMRIASLDDMRAKGKSGIFGGGLLLSNRAAAERAAAERAAAERAAAEKWKLSDREMQMVGMLGGGA